MPSKKLLSERFRKDSRVSDFFMHISKQKAYRVLKKKRRVQSMLLTSMDRKRVGLFQGDSYVKQEQVMVDDGPVDV